MSAVSRSRSAAFSLARLLFFLIPMTKLSRTSLSFQPNFSACSTQGLLSIGYGLFWLVGGRFQAPLSSARFVPASRFTSLME